MHDISFSNPQNVLKCNKYFKNWQNVDNVRGPYSQVASCATGCTQNDVCVSEYPLKAFFSVQINPKLSKPQKTNKSKMTLGPLI